MFSNILKTIAGLGLLATSTLSASAMPIPATQPSTETAIAIPVANGCGWHGYRGPMGACHSFGTGPFPGGYYGPYGHSFAMDHGCGAGRYRGPWGSCHKFGTGPYPGGYFGPYYNNN
jgi:hypothetical protein